MRVKQSDTERFVVAVLQVVWVVASQFGRHAGPQEAEGRAGGHRLAVVAHLGVGGVCVPGDVMHGAIFVEG